MKRMIAEGELLKFLHDRIIQVDYNCFYGTKKTRYGFYGEELKSFLKKSGGEFDIEGMEEKLFKIEQWCNAYPVKIFPELAKQDFAKIHKILKGSGYTLDRITASNFRYILKGIAKITGVKNESDKT